MKRLYLIFFNIIVLLLGSCTSESPYFQEDIDSINSVPVFFYLENPISTDQTTKEAVKSNIVSPSDSQTISVSMQEEEWEARPISADDTRTSWPTSANQVSWVTGDQIGIFMRNSSGVSGPYDRNNVLYRVGTGGSSSTTLTAGSSPIYYPDKTTNMKFYAYYPYSASVSSLLLNYSLPADQSTSQGLSSADLMLSTTPTANGASPGIALSFSHQMVLLSFQVKSSVALASGTLTNLKVSGTAVTNTGTLDLSTGTLTPSTTSTFSASVNTSKLVSSSSTAYVDVIINPCVISGNSTLLPTQIKVTLTFGLLSHTTYLVVNQTFAKGTRYIYNLNVALPIL